MIPTEKVSDYILNTPEMAQHLQELIKTVRAFQVRFPKDALADALREWFQMLGAEDHPKTRRMLANIGPLREVNWYQVAEGVWR